MNILTRIKRIFHRPPDFTIGDRADPYMLRWYVIPRNRWFNIYLHRVCKSDDDRALHDHPWASLSIILRGSYWEITEVDGVDCWTKYRRGRFIYRSSTYSHRLFLTDDKPCWTLFITGKRVRDWGFYCPKGWVPWQEFTSGDITGNTRGKGCGD